MDSNDPVKLEDFETVVLELSSKMSSILEEVDKEDSSVSEEESRLQGLCTLLTPVVADVPHYCEVLSFLEKNGINSFDSFSGSKLETERYCGESSLDWRVSFTNKFVGAFQPHCLIDVYNDKLQLQQEILCSLDCTLDDLYSEIVCYNMRIASKIIKVVTWFVSAIYSQPGRRFLQPFYFASKTSSTPD